MNKKEIEKLHSEFKKNKIESDIVKEEYKVLLSNNLPEDELYEELKIIYNKIKYHQDKADKLLELLKKEYE